MTSSVEDLVPSGFCEKCRPVSLEYIRRRNRESERDTVIFHSYETFLELESSGMAGCLLCQHLWRCLILRADDTDCLYDGVNISVDLMMISMRSVLLTVHMVSDYGKIWHITGSRFQDAGAIEIQGFKAEQKETCLESIIRKHIQPWIAECQLQPRVEGQCTHAECNTLLGPSRRIGRTRKPQLPTRVIDLGEEGGFLRLYEPTYETSGLEIFEDYVMLSYCWGDGNWSSRTTRANYDQRRQQIPTVELSQTILDAITVTRFLSQRYLFVDAVCILQADEGEDPADWWQEAPRMGQYYQNAFVTIGAYVAADSGQGFLTERPAERHGFAHKPLFLATDDEKIKPDKNTASGIEAPRPDVEMSIDKSPLARRGWALQERALSRRMLYFCRDTLYWECDYFLGSEHSPGGIDGVGDSTYYRLGSHMRARALKKYTADFVLGSQWSDLVYRFSELQFTNVKDKPMALQGIADRTLSMFPTRYVAGYFVKGMLKNLCWHVPLLDGRDKDDGEEAPVAPSWSWLSQAERIVFTAKYDSVHVDLVTVEDFPLNTPRDYLAKHSVEAANAAGLALPGTLVLSGYFRTMTVRVVHQDGGIFKCVLPTGASATVYFDRWSDVPVGIGIENMTLDLLLTENRYYFHGCVVLKLMLKETILPRKGVLGFFAPHIKIAKRYKRVGWMDIVPGVSHPPIKEGWEKTSLAII